MVEYYGKYRAKVVDIKDPEERGRVRVECPKVLEESKSSWCETCVPVAGDEEGDFCLPKMGETVWIEFEDGDANKPILTGGWYGEKKSPLKDYKNADKERIISFKKNKIVMQEGYTYLTNKNSVILIKKDDISIATDAPDPLPSPLPEVLSKSVISVGKENIKITRDTSKVEMGKDSIKLTVDSSKVSIDKSSIVLEVNGAKINIASGGVTIDAGGSACSFNAGSLSTLKKLIGG